MTECPVCYAQVAQDVLNGHMMWHSQQRQILELAVKNIEGVLAIIETLTKSTLPRGPR